MGSGMNIYGFQYGSDHFKEEEEEEEAARSCWPAVVPNSH